MDKNFLQKNDIQSGSNTAKTQIINIVRRSLGYIDSRLIDHGDRVAYIASAIADMSDNINIDKDKLFVLCLIHDIGAYKTEEIDNMVKFETGSVKNHSVYGYLFLRNATPLKDFAEAILYHHTDYNEIETMSTDCKLYAELIFLADRADIVLLSEGEKGLKSLAKFSGTSFNPEFVKLLYEAERKNNLSAHIVDGTYKFDVARRIDDIWITVEETNSFLEMLVYSIDFRSPFTVTHTANTTAISEYLAKLVGIKGDELEDVKKGAFLHDIGKIAIPYSILESTGKLSAEEMEIMKTHVSVGEKILKGIVSDKVMNIATRHHEKLNGKGYCKGLTANELSLSESVVAVSDIISALISKRSYKEPFSKDVCLSILNKLMFNGELDEKVCKTAVSHFDEIVNITVQKDDPIIKLYEKTKNQFQEYLSRN